MPRSVPALRLTEVWHWAKFALSPCSANSRAQNVRAKNPRSSSRRSSSITNAPLRRVSAKRIRQIPVELAVDLTRAQQVLELLQPGEASEEEDIVVHVDTFEQFPQLPSTFPCIPAAREARQPFVDLVERYLIAAIVRSRRAKLQ